MDKKPSLKKKRIYLKKKTDFLDNFRRQYIQIMSKDSKQTTENRLISLKKLKTDFLKIYSPSYDDMHILVLGLLNDVIDIFEKEIAKKNKQIPVNTQQYNTHNLSLKNRQVPTNTQKHNNTHNLSLKNKQVPVNTQQHNDTHNLSLKNRPVPVNTVNTQQNNSHNLPLQKK